MITLEAYPAHATSYKTHVLDVDSLMREVRETPPVCRVRTPDGALAWLVTRHADVRKLLLDDTLSHSPQGSQSAPEGPDLLEMVLRDDHQEEAGSHEEKVKVRKLFHPHFGPRRILDMRPRLEALAEEMLDAFVSKGAPADLHAEFSVPFVIAGLGEMLGIPASDREWCVKMISQFGNFDDPQGATSAAQDLVGYLDDLLVSKRTGQHDDVISGVSHSDQQHVAAKVMLVMFAGFGSLVSQIDGGFLLFATHPEQREALGRDPELLPKAVEEVLRMVGSLMMPRYTTQDTEVAGVTIPANELVLFDLTLANFDEEVFDRPERFDITRSPNPHVSFSHGQWTCLGAALARVQLQAAFRGLFNRLPAVHPVVPLDQLRKSTDQIVGGIDDLKVAW